MAYCSLLNYETREQVEWVEMRDKETALQCFGQRLEKNLTFDQPEDSAEPMYWYSEYPTPAPPPPESAIWIKPIPVYEDISSSV